jgi:threonine dehydrogenase-like Zn-dependent dehydrogenase
MKRDVPEAPMNGALALWYVRRREVELRPATLPHLGPDEVRIKTVWSGISRGTERLVFEGHVPHSESERMRGPFQEGDFPYPVKYGYCAVGLVEEGPAAFAGRTVFVLHPHQSRFVVPVAMAHPVPDAVPARRAILAANMETALNAVWDSGACPGDRIAVVGAGTVGCLVAFLAAAMAGTEVTLVDIDLSRADIARQLGVAFRKPLDAPDGMDLVFHASGYAPGLACALACAGQEATVVEMSWYGDRMVQAPLGLDFHARRLKLISSQVGQVSPSRRPRWDHRRRMGKALELLADSRLDALITTDVAFADLPSKMGALVSAEATGLVAAVRYN